MLHISGDLEITQGTETIKFKTNGENQLVLGFSSWKVFGFCMRLPKKANSDFFSLRKKLKYISTPIKVEIGEGDSFLLVKGKPQSISISTLFKVIRHTFVK
jgi:hypothetical protein